MERKFNVGDRVRVVKTAPRTKGSTCPGVAIGSLGVVVGTIPGTPSGYVTFDLDEIKSDHPTGLYACPPDWLRHVYDGNERVAWSECVWQPKQVRA